ncbi:hypothetical protein HMPREF3113_03230 [Stenotrophomonas sp. HMSC10F06]|nr:hypothetical protein HMPREF3113_03230 [Stenotrophomonas sp. HMSC10F06]
MPAASAAAVCLMEAAGSRRARRGLAPPRIPVRARARSPARILAQVPVPTLLRGRVPARDLILQVLDQAQALDLDPVLAPGRIRPGHPLRRPRRRTGTIRSGTPPRSPQAWPSRRP